MTCSDDTAWLDARIAATKTAIEAVEDAITALAGGAFSYTLDTGQTRQTVTKANVASLRTMLDSLDNRLATLQARRCGSSSRVIPGW
jgi:hypothetical protein